jgi:hypothetical protein
MEFLTRIIPTPEVAARIVDVYDHAQWVLVTVSVALAAAGFAGLNLVWKIKESIYDKEEYQKVVRELQDIEPGLEVFRPWKVLSRVEGWFIGVCVLSATMQVTVGFRRRWIDAHRLRVRRSAPPEQQSIDCPSFRESRPRQNAGLATSRKSPVKAARERLERAQRAPLKLVGRGRERCSRMRAGLNKCGFRAVGLNSEALAAVAGNR